MTIPRIHVPESLEVAARVTLDAAASHHLLTVLRVPRGADIVLFDGRGGEYRAKLVAARRREAVLDVTRFDPVDRESRLPIELGLPVLRGERMDWVLQKATELGVAAIVPLLHGRGHTAGAEARHAHWRRVVIHACEQSGRNLVPPLTGPVPLAEWASRASGQRLALTPRDGTALSLPAGIQSVSLVSGPEAGFDDDERACLVASGFVPVTLGPRVLRAETAPLVALSLLQWLAGNLAAC